ncbi:hypothetical protein HZH66_014034 [Vespula vulgaris]|uniref:Uncharacterized protein n=1 Tax=Vespula vulgaris TaxID=7454 RepID=A0A834J508_VESVU|nr:hypothetical protein HZH66_014034 [Vespula vulgaris]
MAGPDEYYTDGFRTYRLSTVLSISTRIAITARNSEKPDENQHHQRKLITIPSKGPIEWFVKYQVFYYCSGYYQVGMVYKYNCKSLLPCVAYPMDITRMLFWYGSVTYIVFL